MSVRTTAAFIRLKHSAELIFIPDDDVRQCLLYDSAESDARLIGIEYMITPELFDALSPEEQKLWHSHVYEVKSGMLVMPNPLVTEAVWARAEHKEMENVVRLYGKAYHLWQTDLGHKLPIGEPKLMASFTTDGQLDFSKVEERDKKFGVSYEANKTQRQDIPEPKIHPSRSLPPVAPLAMTLTTDVDSDSAWKDSGKDGDWLTN